MGGYGNGLFGVNDNLSRAQLAQILYNKEGRPFANEGNNFTDVDTTAWYADAVTQASAQGIVSGFGSGKFGPNDPITREQLAVMLWRYSGSPSVANKELNFSDTSAASGYTLKVLPWAVENSIISDCGNGQLGPKGTNSSNIEKLPGALTVFLNKEVPASINTKISRYDHPPNSVLAGGFFLQ